MRAVVVVAIHWTNSVGSAESGCVHMIAAEEQLLGIHTLDCGEQECMVVDISATKPQHLDNSTQRSVHWERRVVLEEHD